MATKKKSTPEKPAPPTWREIDEDLQRSIEILGLDARSFCDTENVVYDFYVEYIKKHKMIPSQRECADELGVDQSRISSICQSLVRAGRMRPYKVLGRKSGYVPIVT